MNNDFANRRPLSRGKKTIIVYCVSNRKARAFVIARHKSLKIFWKTPCDYLQVSSVVVSLGRVWTCRSRYSDWRANAEEQSRSAAACWPPPDRRTSLPPTLPPHITPRATTSSRRTLSYSHRTALARCAWRSCAFSLLHTSLPSSHHPSHNSPPVQGRRHRTDDSIIIAECTTYVVSRHVFSTSSPPTIWRSLLPSFKQYGRIS